MKCDLHVHTLHSGKCSIPVLRHFCRESYSEPAEVYEKLKRAGMDLVTVTDHDSIGAAEELRSHADFFLSEEVTCTLPNGGELHVGVYDITDEDHIEFERRRGDFESFRAYLEERKLFYSANHIFSSLTGRRRIQDFELFEHAFPAVETHNGHMLRVANDNAALLAGLAARAEVGGSDAHALVSVGCAYTVVREARDKQGYLEGLRQSMGCVRGETGGILKLTRDLWSIGRHMAMDDPRTTPVALLGGLAVPLVTLGNYVVESVFARLWMARYLEMRAVRIADSAEPMEAV